ncbi:MAG TPA: carboxypeptidase regulatory-like domain-containing protein [Longimicrobium sp.]|nr:carboxypeptidase regulatory-like domain-containing protein [Longimicrobium sp.]
MPSSALRIRPLLALAAAAACIPATAAAQAQATGSIRVVVQAERGGGALKGARVELLGARIAANSDDNGIVRLASVPAGPAIVSVHKFGYGDERFPLTVRAGDTVTVEVDLQTETVRLAEVRATASYSVGLRNTGFLDRKKVGLGTYAMRADWERRGRLNFSDVLRRMRGVRVMQTYDGRSLLVPPRPSGTLRGCQPMLYVDGVHIHVDQKYDDINNIIPLGEIEAIEAYAGPAEIPAQFNATGSACSVVLVWRRA